MPACGSRRRASLSWDALKILRHFFVLSVPFKGKAGMGMGRLLRQRQLTDFAVLSAAEHLVILEGRAHACVAHPGSYS